MSQNDADAENPQNWLRAATTKVGLLPDADAIRQAAAALGIFYTELVARGVPAEQALELTARMMRRGRP